MQPPPFLHTVFLPPVPMIFLSSSCFLHDSSCRLLLFGVHRFIFPAAPVIVIKSGSMTFDILHCLTTSLAIICFNHSHCFRYYLVFVAFKRNKK